ncbi:epithelial cell-transforming sequence 2 oncogene-like [Sorex araneus]|uniref:epithelial cell-transforming sequence 2 oncogene-like n=1 Tax=Sorex araneus TaxID=42254 RepID=UPI00243350E5|nr:epithelial cell-transforming sequence 2 oncogene-like [Sorex araneus]
MSAADSSRETLEMESFHTRFSAWTPFCNKSLNRQLFQERVALIRHWFDLWTNKQRQEFLLAIFLRCTKSQIRFVQDWFSERMQVANADFSTVLPRSISLYIFSFLNPKDLCAAAQVSWPWRFLTEQDCLWRPKCIKFGWFLPYTPTDKEYGAWKHHYIACVSSLDWLTPREAAAIYGTLNEPKAGDEELQERLREKCLRKIIWENTARHKKKLFKVRPPWLSGTRCSRLLNSKCQPRLSQPVWDRQGLHEALEKQLVLASLEALPSRSNVSGSRSYPLLKSSWRGLSPSDDSTSRTSSPHLIVISSRIPAYEMVVASVRAGVISLVYDHSGITLESLLYLIDKALDGQRVTSMGILSNGNSREVNLLQGYNIGVKNVLRPEVRDFWEKLGSYVVPEEEGGHVDLFVPLGASESGVEVLSQLSQLTGTLFTAPSGVATGSYQHILSDWLWQPGERPPPCIYFSEAPLQAWCRLTDDLDDALRATRKQLAPQFRELQASISEISVVGMERNGRKDHPQGTSVSKSDQNFEELVELERKLQMDAAVKRTRVAQELLESERKYVQTLEVVRAVYVVPLRAALSSNRAILSAANIQIIFSDILRILSLNRQFLDHLRDRLQAWSPAHCLGEIILKFGRQLNIYTNFFNNYPVVLKTIEKCREMTPEFRAFLKRHDKTIITQMLSLPELLLFPSRRFEEYIHLLYALRLHTPAEHADRGDLTAAIDQMKNYKGHIDQMKQIASIKDQLSDIQRTIWGCPTLSEENRYLIRVQDVAQLHCYRDEGCFFVRHYQHTRDLSLFLFNDALLISSRATSHTPFERTSKSTYQFLASIALHRLLIEDIPDSRYIKNAFVLQGPKREWICATETVDDKFLWLSALQNAIRSSVEK